METIQSIQIELSHVLTTYFILKNSQHKSRYLMLIPVMFHIVRYYKNFKRSIEISKKQLHSVSLVLLTILNFTLIYNHKKSPVLFGIISGLITLYHVYNTYKDKKMEENYLEDVFMILLSVLLMYFDHTESTKFGSSRELTYHLLEWLIY